MTTFTEKPNSFCPKSRSEWRRWLKKNHATSTSVHVILYRQNSGYPVVTYEAAVEEALCFGWIDSVRNARDSKSFYQYFAPRKPKSNWSRLNRSRMEKMIAAGKMEPAGMAMVELAKCTGTWEALEDVQNNIIPPDLQKAFNKNKKAAKNFEAFPPSSKRIILEWIMNAKRPETRLQRIEKTVEQAAQNVKANHYRQ